MNYRIPSWPNYADDEIKKVSSVLSSGLVNSWTGSNTKEFELAFSQYLPSKFSVALANGSLALSSFFVSWVKAW